MVVMRSSISFIYVLTSTLLVFTSCASISPGTTRNVFTFNYEDQEFQIISITTTSGEGSNFLVLIDSTGSEVINGKDADQNGTIDQILSGNYSLEEVNIIYQAGITSAQEKGNYRERIPERTFEYFASGYHFVIRSYIISDTNVSNLFIVRNDSLSTELILMDTQADGQLDHFEKGSTDTITNYQYFYEATLGIGIKEHRIILKNGIYIVNQIPGTGSDRSNSYASLH